MTAASPAPALRKILSHVLPSDRASGFRLAVMIAFPPCKINLGLRVTAKRPDGFHDLQTCFYTLPWTDVLEVIHAPQTSFAYSGHVVPGDPLANLCVKAYEQLRRDFGLGPISAHLHKIIPMGAGLGGGSSDGAHMLRLLNVLFELDLDNAALARYAADLGSDCAYFIYDTPMIGRGRGEILTPAKVSLQNTYAVVLKPDLHISTAEAFSGIDPRRPDHDIAEVIALPRDEWKHHLHNDFERSLFPMYPQLLQLKELLYARGAFYASMSGSGSAIYGLFEERPAIAVSSGVIKWEGWLT